MKQEDKLLFVEAIEKDINDHGSRNHWSIVEQTMLPLNAKSIKAIWFLRENENQMTSC